MGRLPTHYAGQLIKFRVPYSMPGELVVAANTPGLQFSEGTFLHGADKPFEIHRVIPRCTQVTAGGVFVNPQPTDGLMEQLIRLRINDTSKNEILLKNPHLLFDLVKGTSERTWEWAEPYYLTRSEGFQVTVDNIDTAAVFAAIRVNIAFQGFLVVLAPPTDKR